MSRPVFTSERVSAEPIKIGQWQVTPVAHARTLRWQRGEGRGFAMAWARPRWLSLTQGDVENRQPVPDATRGLQFMAAALGLLLAWGIARLFGKGARR